MKISFATPESLLPHCYPALLVTEILEYSEDMMRCAGRIPERHPAVQNGLAPSLLAVEFAAQSAGLALVLQGQGNDSIVETAKVGYLVTLREVQIAPEPILSHSVLDARVQMEINLGAVASFTFLVEQSSKIIARGRLGIAIPRL